MSNYSQVEVFHLFLFAAVRAFGGPSD